MYYRLFLFILFICFISVTGQDLSNQYFNMNFTQIVQKLKSVSADGLSLEEQCLLIESQARLGNATKVFTNMQSLLAKFPDDVRVLNTAAIVHQALGQFEKAEHYLNHALQIEPENPLTLLTRTTLLLYQRRFPQAFECFQQVEKKNPEIKQSRLFQRIGYELYSALQNPVDLRHFLQNQHSFYLSQGLDEKAEKFQRKLQLLTKAGNRSLFWVSKTADRIELTMVDFAPDVFYKCLVLKSKNKTYKILLDTGNAVGWTIHHPDLLDLLETYSGMEQDISTGSVEKSLQGQQILTRLLDLGEFQIFNLMGYYFEKPRKNYFDANLNPIFIRNYVVTMDFIHSKFLLRSKTKFDRDLSGDNYIKLPFYGYEWPFVPVKINGYASALAMIETGAEDVSLKEEFARFVHLLLVPATKMWGEKQLNYFKIYNLGIWFDTDLLYRSEVEVWPRRFYDHLTGLYDQVMIGPFALQDRFIISFDPFDNVVVFQSPGRN